MKRTPQERNHVLNTTTHDQTTPEDARAALLARTCFPHAPGVTPWNARAFLEWARRAYGGLSEADLECARLIATLTGDHDIIEDIGAFDVFAAAINVTDPRRHAIRAFLLTLFPGESD